MNIWFINALKSDPQYALLQVLIVVFSICFHEYMHARAALWQGDDTAARSGHLTLNPLKQMGFVSLILLFVAGIAFGQVPVNPQRMRNRHSDAIVSFAGPFANLLLTGLFLGSVIFVMLSGSESPGGQRKFLVEVLLNGAVLNAVLFLLNMLPVPPLDGFGIARSFFPKLQSTTSEFLNGAYFFIIVAIMFSAGILFSVAGYLVTQGLLLTVSPELLRAYFA